MTDKTNSDPVIGTAFLERYEIQSILDAGGMSLIYRALDKSDNKAYAVKFLLAKVPGLETSFDSFQKNVKIVSKLDSPRLVKIHEHGITSDNRPYLLNEFINGKSLFNVLNRHGRLDIERALNIFIEMASGVEELHAEGLVHKDLRPNNVMLTDDENGNERAILIDFGLAKSLLKESNEIDSLKLADDNSFRISTMYLSPEQCTGTAVDFRADVYALGCIMYEALTGLPPFLNKDPFEIIRMHTNDEPRPLRMARNDLDFPLALDLLVLKALRKSPSQRQQSMRDLKEDLIHIKIVLEESNDSALVKSKKNRYQSFEPEQFVADRKSQKDLARRLRLWVPIVFGLIVLMSSSLMALYMVGQRSQLESLDSQSDPSQETLWQDYDASGQRAFERGNTAEAENNYLKALQLAEKFGANDRRLLITLRKLQDVYMTQSRYTEADRVEVRIKELLAQQSR